MEEAWDIISTHLCLILVPFSHVWICVPLPHLAPASSQALPCLCLYVTVSHPPLSPHPPITTREKSKL